MSAPKNRGAGTPAREEKKTARKVAVTPDLFDMPRETLTQSVLRRAVAAFLAAQEPAGLAMRVPSRISRYLVDAAAFWVDRTGSGRNMVSRVSRTVAVDVFTDRGECLPECAGAAELARELRELRAARMRMEARIRENEPWLAVGGELFAEFRTFDYASSSDAEYQKLMRRHSRVQHALFKGSRLEKVRAAGVADYLYIAVPAHVVEPEEIADGWGLLHVYPDGGIRVARVATRQNCSAESRLHLAFNIAACSVESVLFREGVSVDRRGRIRLCRPPRRRLKPLFGE